MPAKQYTATGLLANKVGPGDVIAAGSVFPALGIILSLMRLYTRRIQQQKIHVDDWTFFAGLVRLAEKIMDVFPKYSILIHCRSSSWAWVELKYTVSSAHSTRNFKRLTCYRRKGEGIWLSDSRPASYTQQRGAKDVDTS